MCTPNPTAALLLPARLAIMGNIPIIAIIMPKTSPPASPPTTPAVIFSPSVDATPSDFCICDTVAITLHSSVLNVHWRRSDCRSMPARINCRLPPQPYRAPHKHKHPTPTQRRKDAKVRKEQQQQEFLFLLLLFFAYLCVFAPLRRGSFFAALRRSSVFQSHIARTISVPAFVPAVRRTSRLPSAFSRTW